MVGGAMGRGWFAIDVDLYKGADGEKAQRWLEGLKARRDWVTTRQHRTKSGGLHLLLRGECGSFKPAPGVDIKGNGGYVILPPSAGYAVAADIEAAPAPRSLIAHLESSRISVSTTGVAALEQKVLDGDDFHDPLVQLAARKASDGATRAEISGYIAGLLENSRARIPGHPRHDRWTQLVADESGELARIIGSAAGKFSLAETEAEAVEGFTPEMLAQVTAAGAAAFNTVDAAEDEEHTPAVPTPEYTGVNPFTVDGSGYSVGDEIDITGSPPLIYPLLSEGDTVLLAAEPKAGKTAVTLKLAYHLATGTSLDDDQLLVKDRRGVLYLALESAYAIRTRLEAEKRANPVEGDIPFTVVERGVSMWNEQAQLELVKKVLELDAFYRDHFGCPLGMVVIDTLSQAMPGGDQNSAADTSQLFKFNQVLRDAGCSAALVYLHHLSRQGNVRGSTNIEAMPDTILRLEKDDDGKAVSLQISKARSIDDTKSYRFALESFVLREQNDFGKPDTTVLVKLLPPSGSTPKDDSAEVDEVERAVELGELCELLVSKGCGKHSVQAYYDPDASDGKVKQSNALRKRIDSLLPQGVEGHKYGDRWVTVTRSTKGRVSAINVMAFTVEQMAPG